MDPLSEAGTPDELDELLDAVREQTLSTAQHDQLAAILTASPEARRRYARYLAFCALVRYQTQGARLPTLGGLSLDSDDSMDEVPSRQGSNLDQAMILPALAAEEADAAAETPPPAWHAQRNQTVRRRWPPGRGGIAAAILLCVTLGLVARWLFREPNPVVARVVSALEARVDGVSLRPGTELREGEIRLTSGWVELTTNHGVHVLVEAPARLTPRRNGRLLLTFGKLTASVPPGSGAFVVETPKASVTDLGTEFGVRVADGGEVATTVFRGKVILNSTTAGGVGGAKPLELIAGQSAKADGQGVRAAVVDDSFVRDIRQVSAPIAVRSTGDGIEPGAVDPNWTISAVQDDPAGAPGPAYVLRQPMRGYLANEEHCKWMATGPDSPNVGGNARYTFATSFDLAGMNPAAARLTLRLAVDNGISAIRLNGQETGISLDRNVNWMESAKEVVIDGGFVAGVNRLEIVVINLEKYRGVASPIGLRAEVSGSATRVVEHQ